MKKTLILPLVIVFLICHGDIMGKKEKDMTPMNGSMKEKNSDIGNILTEEMYDLLTKPLEEDSVNPQTEIKVRDKYTATCDFQLCEGTDIREGDLICIVSTDNPWTEGQTYVQYNIITRREEKEDIISSFSTHENRSLMTPDMLAHINSGDLKKTASISEEWKHAEMR